jgi:hypothetical protein
MGLATIDQLFSSPWGIVEFRRLEIEVGPYGAYERVLEEEVGRNFGLPPKNWSSRNGSLRVE